MLEKTNYRFDPDPYNTHVLLLNEVPDNSRVLEIGTASGYIGEYLTKQKKCEVWGVEPVKEEYDKALQYNYAKLFHLTGEEFLQLPEVSQEKFDIIFLSDVLEHMVHPDQVLAGLKKFLKPTGRFVMSIPNVAIYTVRLQLLTGHWDMQDGGILDRTHVRFFTYKTMHELLDKSGLKILTERPAGGYMERFGKRKLFGIGRRILRRFPKLFAMHFIFVAVPK
jgi:2-polyprenyl-3-methyl-5-hydroxy-6-metoxy-1,4-benzoquinol methylase